MKLGNVPSNAKTLYFDMHASFDAIYLIQDAVYLKHKNKWLGFRSNFIDLTKPLSKQLDNEGFLISVRSNAFSNFRFPIAIYGMCGETGDQVKEALFPLIEDFNSYLKKLGGKIHFVVCDAAHSHNKVNITLCFAHHHFLIYAII